MNIPRSGPQLKGNILHGLPTEVSEENAIIMLRTSEKVVKFWKLSKTYRISKTLPQIKSVTNIVLHLVELFSIK